MPIRPVEELVQDAKSQIETLSPEATLKKQQSGTALLVDIRDIRELGRAGRIPGAFHVPRGLLEFWIDPASQYHKPELATDKTLILFCAGAWRSALAVRTLQEMGVENIAEMGGGFSGWNDAGLPVDPPKSA